MEVTLERKDARIKDRDIKNGFDEFSNGFFDDIATNLYQKDEQYFLHLKPVGDKVLKSEMCININDGSDFKTVIEELTNNIGIMLSEETGQIEKKQDIDKIVEINGKEVSLVEFEQMHIEGKELYKGEGLENKIKESSSKLFGKEANSEVPSYAKNAMFTKFNGKQQLSEEEFEKLKYYKEEGYEFLNSFLGDGELKTRGNIAKEHIGNSSNE